MQNRNAFPFYVILVLIIILFANCKKDVFEDMQGASIAFSNDTVIFDTTFHSVGTPTKTLKVYNRNNFDVTTSITLQGINEGNFRMNVDGVPTNSMTNIEILANDSIFIFLEVTPNQNITNEFLLTTKLIFTTGNNTQEVDLVAPGKNAYFHLLHDNLFFDGTDTVIIKYYSISNNTTWESDLPHVIYGDVVVEPGATLTIEAGSKIYFHANSGIYIGNPLLVNANSIPANNGTLLINGVKENEVIFQGDRLGESYKNIPGQWGSIYFVPGSNSNKVEYAIIRNGTIGLRADSVIGNDNVVTINNTIIENMSSIGILGQGSRFKVKNTLIKNCGQYIIACNIGGDYEFKHCTFVNYWNWNHRNTPSILLNNYYEDISGNIRVRELEKAYFGNCIIDGSLSTEISFQKNELGNFNYTFDHCLIKIDPNENTATNHYVDIIKNETPSFVNYQEDDYRLDSLSIAIDAGDVNITNSDIELIFDLLGESRSNFPDLGCYERP